MTTPSFAVEPLSSIGTFPVEEHDFVYARADVKLATQTSKLLASRTDGLELRAHSYRPAGESPQPRAAVVEVHGGAWNLNDRMAGEHYNRALASTGLHVMAIDFRQGPDHKHPSGSRDVAGAVRYLRAHADALHVDASRIGLIGSSSGGHLALLAGIEPHAEKHRGTPLVLPEGSPPAGTIAATVDYVIALWPVSDPAYRYRYAREVGRDRLAQLHESYFVSVQDMADASIARTIEAGEAVAELPAILVVQPGADANIPRPMTFALMDAYQQAGGAVEYAFFPGEPHGFAHRPSNATDECIRLMRDFVQRRLTSNKPAAGPG